MARSTEPHLRSATGLKRVEGLSRRKVWTLEVKICPNSLLIFVQTDIISTSRMLAVSLPQLSLYPHLIQSSLGYQGLDHEEAEGAGRIYSYVQIISLPSMQHTDLCFPAVTVVSPRMGEHGWPFGNVDSFPGADADPVIGASHVKDLYLKADSEFAGR
jgi:hypothetical protein